MLRINELLCCRSYTPCSKLRKQLLWVLPLLLVFSLFDNFLLGYQDQLHTREQRRSISANKKKRQQNYKKLRRGERKSRKLLPGTELTRPTYSRSYPRKQGRASLSWKEEWKFCFRNCNKNCSHDRDLLAQTEDHCFIFNVYLAKQQNVEMY
jgi:hypothetical protein